ncbi:hypothetical protein COOONC_11407 [Cooperia oncophora]
MNGGIMNYMDQLQILLFRMYSLILPTLIYIIYITCTTRKKAGKSRLVDPCEIAESCTEGSIRAVDPTPPG